MNLNEVNDRLKEIKEELTNEGYKYSLEFELYTIALDEIANRLTNNRKQDLFDDIFNKVKDVVTENSELEQLVNNVVDTIENITTNTTMNDIKNFIDDVIDVANETFSNLKEFINNTLHENTYEDNSSETFDDSKSKFDLDVVIDSFKDVITNLTTEIIPGIKYFDTFTTSVVENIKLNIKLAVYLLNKLIKHKMTTESIEFDNYGDKYFELFMKYNGDTEEILNSYSPNRELICQNITYGLDIWDDALDNICESINIPKLNNDHAIKQNMDTMEEFNKIIEKFNTLDNCVEKDQEEPQPTYPPSYMNSALSVTIWVIVGFLSLLF
jgi:hypothetical protein